MTSKFVQPELGGRSFSCPHTDCGAVAHQNWYEIYFKNFAKDQGPTIPEADVVQRWEAKTNVSEPLKEYFRKKLSKLPFEQNHENGVYLNWQWENVWACECYSCKGWSIWIGDRLVYPNQIYSVEPNAEMPTDIKTDFLEAASVVDISPRAAAALLRLCVQKLVIGLGENGDNLNRDIGNLVANGTITKSIQQALDVVRVVGNNAVHPGVLDFNDNKTIAVNLFRLVNVIVEATIATPSHIQGIYEQVVPAGVRAAIEKRDAPRLAGSEGADKC